MIAPSVVRGIIVVLMYPIILITYAVHGVVEGHSEWVHAWDEIWKER